MKLKEWLDNLNEQVKANPELLELDIVTSADDEGNSFGHVNYTASAGNYDHSDRDFTSASDDEFEGKPNAVCLN